LIVTLSSCRRSDNIVSIDESLPSNVLENVITATPDGTNIIQLTKNTKKIDTTFVVANLSDYEISYEHDTYYVRLQKKINNQWVFIDGNPYVSQNNASTMTIILPGMIYASIPISIDIDPKTFDFNAEYRFYIPVEYRPKEKNSPENAAQKACLVMNVIFTLIE